MKHSKHSNGSNWQENDIDIVSSSKKHSKADDSNVILSKTPKGRIALDVIAKILFILSAASMVVLAIVLTLTSAIDYIPVLWLLIFIVFIGIFVGFNMWLLAKRKKVAGFGFYFKRGLSVFLSVIIAIPISVVGFVASGILNVTLEGFLGDITIGGEVNEDQVEDISEHPFVVYLSGLDTRKKGEIAEKGLSDVNMVVAVNPQQKRILMVSTPRDYYVGIDGDPNKLDKLTHAGNKGIKCSMKTMEALYGIKFNYYAKVNFKSVYDIVNAVDGVTVNSEYDFYSRYSYSGRTYHFTKGKNNLTGDSALAFARERKSFANGDRQRGIHQQVVIKAVVEKAISPSMITSHSDEILKAISENTKTNFSTREIKGLIKYQLSTMSEDWKFESMSVDGTGDYAYTYSYPGQPLYVMRPDQETVLKAKAAINAVLEGKPIPEDASNISNTSAQ